MDRGHPWTVSATVGSPYRDSIGPFCQACKVDIDLAYSGCSIICTWHPGIIPDILNCCGNIGNIEVKGAVKTNICLPGSKSRCSCGRSGVNCNIVIRCGDSTACCNNCLNKADGSCPCCPPGYCYCIGTCTTCYQTSCHCPCVTSSAGCRSGVRYPCLIGTYVVKTRNGGCGQRIDNNRNCLCICTSVDIPNGHNAVIGSGRCIGSDGNVIQVSSATGKGKGCVSLVGKTCCVGYGIPVDAV